MKMATPIPKRPMATRNAGEFWPSLGLIVLLFAIMVVF